ncbi:MAG: GatB/YqeY domain-containing protein [Gemmatimonadetes bacterium]|nr:GatB/YqeY domain-containing protein [Gemmatimonadota bacterium]
MSDAAAAGGAPLLARLQAEQVAARKAQDRGRVLLLGTVVSEARNREIELRRALTDDDVVEVLRKAVKKRREASGVYAQAGRADMADREAAEAVALEAFLPAAVDPEEIRAAIREAVANGATAVGAVMGAVLPRFKGRVDGAVVSALVREALAAR